MPVDAGGNATRPPSPIPVSGQNADAPQVNVPINDIYAILNMLMFLDGRKPLRGNITMNGRRAVGAGDAEQPQDYVTLAQLQAFLTDVTTPSGIIQAYTVSSSVAPAGWIFASGQTLQRSVFPNLWSAVQSGNNLAATEAAKTHGQYGPGDGSTTFTVPNLYADGGYFIRPMTSGRGIGTVQGDAFKEHSHTGIRTSVTVPVGGWGTQGGAPRPGVSIPAGRMVTGSGESEAVEILESIRAAGSSQNLTLSGDGETSVTGGPETRPKNIAYPVIIKA